MQTPHFCCPQPSCLAALSTASKKLGHGKVCDMSKFETVLGHIVHIRSAAECLIVRNCSANGRPACNQHAPLPMCFHPLKVAASPCQLKFDTAFEGPQLLVEPTCRDDPTTSMASHSCPDISSALPHMPTYMVQTEQTLIASICIVTCRRLGWKKMAKVISLCVAEKT